jgi:hypothetical protein
MKLPAGTMTISGQFAHSLNALPGFKARSACTVGKNSLAVALLVIGGARIGIFHAVTQRVVKEYCDLCV